jgi:hypothetical protein
MRHGVFSNSVTIIRHPLGFTAKLSLEILTEVWEMGRGEVSMRWARAHDNRRLDSGSASRPSGRFVSLCERAKAFILASDHWVDAGELARHLGIMTREAYGILESVVVAESIAAKKRPDAKRKAPPKKS